MPGQLVLRAFSAEERDVLAAKLKGKKLPMKIHERYRLVALVAEGMSANAAGKVVGCTDVKAQHWVRRSNASAFATFEKQPNHPGRTIIIDVQQVRALIRVALSRPEDLGLPFTQWSVSKLRAYCLKEGLIPPITGEWEPPAPSPRRRLVSAYEDLEGINYPEFEVKKPRPRPL